MKVKALFNHVLVKELEFYYDDGVSLGEVLDIGNNVKGNMEDIYFINFCFTVGDKILYLPDRVWDINDKPVTEGVVS